MKSLETRPRRRGGLGDGAALFRGGVTLCMAGGGSISKHLDPMFFHMLHNCSYVLYLLHCTIPAGAV